MASLFSRPYVEALAGDFVEQSNDHDSRRYKLRFRSRAATAPTIVRVSEDDWAYAEGYDVLVQPIDKTRIVRQPPYRVAIEVDEPGIEVELTIAPKSKSG